MPCSALYDVSELSLGLHAYCAVDADDLAVDVGVLDDVLRQRGVLVGHA